MDILFNNFLQILISIIGISVIVFMFTKADKEQVNKILDTLLNVFKNNTDKKGDDKDEK